MTFQRSLHAIIVIVLTIAVLAVLPEPDARAQMLDSWTA